LEVVAMGSGTKSLGQSSYSNDGYFLKDMHAEVLARRAFQRYLLKDLLIQKYLKANGDLKPGVSVYMYTSRTPCGDASMSDEYWTGAKPIDSEECKA
jgi:tRNA-specific adenosine deaminase 1